MEEMQKSTKDLKGYAVGATDGDIGKVDDFYFDDKPGPSDIWWPTPELASGPKSSALAYRCRQGGFFSGADQRDTDKEASRGEPQH